MSSSSLATRGDNEPAVPGSKVDPQPAPLPPPVGETVHDVPTRAVLVHIAGCPSHLGDAPHRVRASKPGLVWGLSEPGLPEPDPKITQLASSHMREQQMLLDCRFRSYGL
ncbi:hypothetical protein NUW54_g13741 [Trametes sanguinea]|uniref:Uncharacterized protein n=1 Tax=Trametes sanguinea TaxID=158606 RepID=A0ACC1MJ55_9APHY|nr:hypothetical protein NUW54_g13741 [Trametes sanguinea]